MAALDQHNCIPDQQTYLEPAPQADTGHVHVRGTPGITALLKQSLLGDAEVALTEDDASIKPGNLVIVAQEGELSPDTVRWQKMVAERQISVLMIHIHGGEAVIGPLIRYGQPGCLDCWEQRYYYGRRNARQWAESAAAGGRDPWLFPHASRLVAQLVAVKAKEMLADKKLKGPAWEVYYLNLRTMTGKRRVVLSSAKCEHCRPHPPRKAAPPHLQLSPRFKSIADSDRVSHARDFSPAFLAGIVGPRSGIVSDVVDIWRVRNIATATTSLELDRARLEPCSGFCDRYSTARGVAVLEALERYSGGYDRGSSIVRGSLQSLGQTALDPRSFGLYREQEYQVNHSWLLQFHDRLEIDFVWGHSFLRREPVLVPRQLVYYMEKLEHEPTYVVDSSAGCALGGSPEEAMLHGLMELIERDSFLMAWYTKRKLAVIDLDSCGDPEVHIHRRRLNMEGYEVTALCSTTDFGIPATIVLARHRSRDKRPYAMCIGSAHYRPERALRKALRELMPGLRRFEIELCDKDQLRKAQMLVENPQSVQTMEDHALLYSMPESAAALDFLISGRESKSVVEMEDSVREIWSADLTEELSAIIARILKTGHDVVAVNQSSVETQSAGLYCYKVLVPGAIPMTWGQHLRRLHGLPRLEKALFESAAVPGVRTEPNSEPHPFP